MIVLTGHIHTDPEILPSLFARLTELCAPSRAEDGCIFYHMGVEDADKGVIMAMEGWRDRDALMAHLSLPAIAQLLADFDGKVEMNVTIHDVSESKPFGL
jgi:quinol monooxygenase YgiN